MAKLLASEYCRRGDPGAFRIHGGYGYSKEYEIERLMREAPFLLIGEGTSEIQKTIISRGLLKDLRPQALSSAGSRPACVVPARAGESGAGRQDAGWVRS